MSRWVHPRGMRWTVGRCGCAVGVAGLYRVVLVAGVLTLGVGVTACGGGSGPPVATRPSATEPTVSRAAPTGSATPERTIALPTRSSAATPEATPTPSETRTSRPTLAPGPTSAPAPSPTPKPPTTKPAPSPTPAPTPSPTPAPPSPQAPAPTPAPTQASATTPALTTAAPAPTATPSPAASSSSSSASWVWWLVGLLAAAAVAAFAMMGVRRQHAREAWLAQRDGALVESRWLARELLPMALAAG